MKDISKMFMDNLLFHFGIKTHPAPTSTHSVLFVVHRIPEQEVLISDKWKCEWKFKVTKNSQGDPQENEIWM